MKVLINKNGDILPGFVTANGIMIDDGNFKIALYYDEESRKISYQIKELKHYLKNTDYKALKYSDGAYTEEEYAPIKKERQKCRDLINELEPQLVKPTITREEMDDAEEKAMEHLQGLS